MHKHNRIALAGLSHCSQSSVEWKLKPGRQHADSYGNDSKEARS